MKEQNTGYSDSVILTSLNGMKNYCPDIGRDTLRKLLNESGAEISYGGKKYYNPKKFQAYIDELSDGAKVCRMEAGHDK